jgi:iron complex outermembrane receptor protein
MKLYLLPALLLALPAAAEESLLVDIPQVRAAAAVRQQLTDTPASLTLIDRELIRVSGARSIPELLRLVPGFQSFRVDANKWATTYHGVADDFPNRLEIRIDGRSVYLPLLSTVNWTSLGITLEDIERIEVVRGSNAATQGSNAFNGSINIITRSAQTEDGYRISSELGSRDAQHHHLSYSAEGFGGHYRISTGYRENSGSARFEDDGLLDRYLNVALSRPIGLQHTLSFSAGIDRGAIGSSTDYGTDLGRFHAQRQHDAHYQTLQWEYLHSASGTLTFSASQQEVDLRTPLASDAELALFFSPLLDGYSASQLQTFRDANPGLRTVAEHGHSRIRDLELRLTEQHDRMLVSSSLGWRSFQQSSDLLLRAGTAKEERWRLQGSLEWRPSQQWTFNSGALIESNADNDALNLRQSLNYKPDAASVLRLGWSRSERLPSLLETHHDSRFYVPELNGWIIDYHQYTPLETERNETWELGYHRRLPQQQFIDLRLFRERIDRAIHGSRYHLTPAEQLAGAILNPGVRTRTNGAAWTTSGIEAQLRWQLAPQLWTLASYSYAETADEQALPEHVDTPVPRHTASLLLNWQPLTDVDLSLVHHYRSTVDWLQNERTRPSSLHQTDLRLARRWRQVDYTFETALLVKGVADSAWQEYSTDNEYRRGIFLQLRLKHP